MRLVDLEPRWWMFAGMQPSSGIWLGLTFLCPHCMTQRLVVAFDPPIDPNNLLSGCTPIVHNCPVWRREGDTFETLTLTPSIDASRDRIDFKGHWHGFIKNGEVIWPT